MRFLHLLGWFCIYGQPVPLSSWELQMEILIDSGCKKAMIQPSWSAGWRTCHLVSHGGFRTFFFLAYWACYSFFLVYLALLIISDLSPASVYRSSTYILPSTKVEGCFGLLSTTHQFSLWFLCRPLLSVFSGWNSQNRLWLLQSRWLFALSYSTSTAGRGFTLYLRTLLQRYYWCRKQRIERCSSHLMGWFFFFIMNVSESTYGFPYFPHLFEKFKKRFLDFPRTRILHIENDKLFPYSVFFFLWGAKMMIKMVLLHSLCDFSSMQKLLVLKNVKIVFSFHFEPEAVFATKEGFPVPWRTNPCLCISNLRWIIFVGTDRDGPGRWAEWEDGTDSPGLTDSLLPVHVEMPRASQFGAAFSSRPQWGGEYWRPEKDEARFGSPDRMKSKGSSSFFFFALHLFFTQLRRKAVRVIDFFHTRKV